jgi:hypothetical protein
MLLGDSTLKFLTPSVNAILKKEERLCINFIFGNNNLIKDDVTMCVTSCFSPQENYYYYYYY